MHGLSPKKEAAAFERRQGERERAYFESVKPATSAAIRVTAGLVSYITIQPERASNFQITCSEEVAGNQLGRGWKLCARFVAHVKLGGAGGIQYINVAGPLKI